MGAQNKGVLLIQIENFGAAEGVITARYNIGTHTKKVGCRFGGYAVAVSRIFTVYNGEINAVTLFYAEKLLPQKISADTAANIAYA